METKNMFFYIFKVLAWEPSVAQELFITVYPPFVVNYDFCYFFR